MKNILSIFIFLVLLLVGIYYFNAGQFGSAGFNVYISILFISCLAFYGFDRLKEIDLKNLKLVLTEIKETKKQVFAKAEEVKKVIEDLAENYVDSATESGRISDNVHEQMIKKRKRAEDLLRKASWEENEIKAKTKKIDDLIIRDMIFRIERSAHQMMKKTNQDRRFRSLGEVDTKFVDLIKKAKSDGEIIENIKIYLKNRKLLLDSFQTQIEELSYFLENKELKL